LKTAHHLHNDIADEGDRELTEIFAQVADECGLSINHVADIYRATR
jgi:hypothetical protein